MPQANIATRSVTRRSAVSRPYGPSTATRVPGRNRASRLLPSPADFAVTRSRSGAGDADNEYGLPRDQPGPSRNRNTKYWPARTGIRCSPRPPSSTVTTSGASWDHFAHGEPVPKRPPERQCKSIQHDRAERDAVRRPPVQARNARDVVKSAPVQISCGMDSPTPTYAYRWRRCHDSYRSAFRAARIEVSTTSVSATRRRDREQHPAVRRDDRPGLTQQIVVIAQRVSGEDQDDVHQQQVERPEPDQPVPARQLVLTVAPLDHRHPCHQEHLDQQQVRGDQSGQPARAT